MIADARATVERGGVRKFESRPPLTLRQVRAATGTVGLCLVGTAAGPLAGDELNLALTVEAGATASLTAAGALVAQAGASRLRTHVQLGAGAALTADPGALVVSAGACVDVSLDIRLDTSASVVWRELIVLGRTGQPPGGVILRWDVRRGDRPLLRQDVDLSRPELASWPGMLARGRVILTELRVGGDLDAATEVHSATAVTQRLAPGATLTTVLASCAADAVRVLTQRHRPAGG